MFPRAEGNATESGSDDGGKEKTVVANEEQEGGEEEEEEEGKDGMDKDKEKEKDKKPFKARTCSDCNRQFCLDYNLPQCKEVVAKDVFTQCFRE